MSKTTLSLVKFTVDLYAPEAVIRPSELKWMSRSDAFHSRRTLYPFHPINELVRTEDGVHIANQDFLHIRMTSIDDVYNSVMDSDIDYALAGEKSLAEFLGEDLFRIAGLAVQKSPPFHAVHRTYAAWLELWEMNQTSRRFCSVGEVDFADIIKLFTEKAP